MGCIATISGLGMIAKPLSLISEHQQSLVIDGINPGAGSRNHAVFGSILAPKQLVRGVRELLWGPLQPFLGLE